MRHRVLPGADWCFAFLAPAIPLLLLLFWIPPAPAVSAPKPAASPAGWVIDQRGKHFGREHLVVSPLGFKWIAEAPAITVMVLPPDGRVVSYNDRNKTYLSATRSDWTKYCGVHGFELGGRKVRKGKSATIAGLKASQYFIEARPEPAGKVKTATARGTAPGTQTPKPPASPRDTHTILHIPIEETEFWVADDIKVAPRLGEIMTKPLGLPSGLGLILRIVEVDRGKRIISLDTTKAEHLSISASVFAIPKGYRRVRNEVALVMEDSDEEMVSDLFGGSAAGTAAAGPGGFSERLKALPRRR